MFSDVPNMARVFACTNSSRILKAHPESEYLCRILNHMRASGNPIATPLPADADITPERRIDFSSGHLERALASFLKPGSKRAWKLHQNDPKDVLLFTFASIEDSSPRRSKKAKRSASVDGPALWPFRAPAQFLVRRKSRLHSYTLIR